MSEKVILYPYKAHKYFVPFTIGSSIFSFLAVGYCLPYIEGILFFLIAIGIISIYLTKKLYDSSKTVVALDSQGLCVVEDNGFDYRYYLWDELQFAYHSKNFRGFRYIVFSPVKINEKQVRELTSKSSESMKVCVDSAVVLYIDNLPPNINIEDNLKNYVANIDIYA